MGKVIPPINEGARRAHRRQSFWHIWLPLAFGVVVAATLFALLMQGGATSIEQGAQAASILLAVPIFVVGFLLFFLLVVANVGMNALMRWLPPQSYKAQRWVRQITSGAVPVARATKQPFLLMESWGAAVDRVIHRRD